MPQATITPISDNLYLVTLPLPLAGFEDFIAVWVHTGTPGFIVDVGPAASVPALQAALQELQLKTLDFILLTHIHLDHAGGIGKMAQLYPDTPILCHPKAIPHLADPARLWQGSLKTLGPIAVAYGEMAPVPGKRLLPATAVKETGVSAFITPGHAPHHVSYLADACLFAGEACGVHITLKDDTVYHRPATPPRFFFETTIDSINLLIAQAPDTICFGHYGMASDARHWLGFHKDQLCLWKDVIGREMKRENAETFLTDCIHTLVLEDPFFAPYAGLAPDVRIREKSLVENSIRGIAGYLQERRIG